MTHQKSTDELLGKNQTTAINFAKEFQVKMDYLKAELKAYKRKEDQWLPRFHVRQKGIQMANVDKVIPERADMPSNTDIAQILRPFDIEIPPSGRV